jgi:hypothetical protein
MKIVFISGIKFTEFDGKYYFITFSSELIEQNYLQLVENFTVFADVLPGNRETTNCMMLSSGYERVP